MAEICILAGPVRSGKTTALEKWAGSRSGIAGFITPDIQGRRVLEDLRTKLIIDFEADENDEDIITIGRFRFSRQAFESGKTIITDAVRSQPEWLVIDEAGKL